MNERHHREPAVDLTIVTLQEVKDRLRVDGDAMDADLQFVLEAAYSAVMRYMKRPRYVVGDTVPPEVPLAVITLVGTYLRDPDGADTAQWQQGYLPWPVINLLSMLRDPTVS